MDRRSLIFGLILALTLGCAPNGSPPPKAPATQAERYAELPGLASSTHAGLKAELALLVQEQMTPVGFDGRRPTQPREPAPLRPAGIRSAIPAISRPCSSRSSTRSIAAGRCCCRRCSSSGPENPPPLGRRPPRFEQEVTACEQRSGPAHRRRLLADLQWLDVLNLGCRLEALAAAEALAENQPEEALAPLAVMLRSARLLAAEWNVATRVAAANLRADALHVLAAVANHEHASHETTRAIARSPGAQTSDWPADADAWIGDRAAGLIAYELVRDGYYLSLLEQGELKQLQTEGLVAVTTKAVMRNVDGDQQFYLAAMRRMIESCRQPYFERVAEL